eukprot:5273359-Pyramimonas_sp.AAC.1
MVCIWGPGTAVLSSSLGRMPPRRSREKLAYIQRYWKGPMMLALQETHASEYSMQVLLERL